MGPIQFYVDLDLKLLVLYESTLSTTRDRGPSLLPVVDQ